LSLPGSSAEPRPEQLFAAATLEALQAPPAVSGITASEVQLALQLSLQQMVSEDWLFSYLFLLFGAAGGSTAQSNSPALFSVLSLFLLFLLRA